MEKKKKSASVGAFAAFSCARPAGQQCGTERDPSRVTECGAIIVYVDIECGLNQMEPVGNKRGMRMAPRSRNGAGPASVFAGSPTVFVHTDVPVLV